MAQEVKNIIQGGAEIYLGADSAAIPSVGNTVTAVGNLTGFTSVGYTSEGLDISFEPEYYDAVVDQLLDSAAMFKTQQRVTVSTSFSEATLENLAFVLGQAASTVTGTPSTAGTSKTITVSGGSLGAEPLVRSFIAVGPSPRTATGNLKTERLYYHPKVISVETVSTGVKRNEASVFPVTFRCLPEAADSGAEYGTVVDRIYGTP